MSAPTPVDAAHAAMQAAGDDDAARRVWADAVLAAELVVWLEDDAGDAAVPRVFALSDGPVVLAFDGEARLAEFAGGPAGFAALPGRALVAMLAGQEVGLALNLGAASAEVLDAAGVAWLAAAAAARAEPRTAPVAALHPPGTLPDALLAVLEARLARAAGLAEAAWLAEAEAPDGSRAPLVVFVGATEGAEGALSRAVAGAAAVAGVALDLAFAAPGEGLAARLARVGLRIDLPAPEPAPRPERDPARPPRLR